MSILRLEGWEGNELKISYKDSNIKYLEEKATKLHNEVDRINYPLIDGKYIIDTFITGVEKDNDYNLSVKIKYYGKSEHECKKNSHGQKIDI